jgi:hypothetical protein
MAEKRKQGPSQADALRAITPAEWERHYEKQADMNGRLERLRPEPDGDHSDLPVVDLDN